MSEIPTATDQAKVLAPGERARSSADKQEILLNRAGVLSRSPEAAVAVDSEIEVLEFELAAETYLLESSFIREIYPLKELTPLPCTPPFVRGIINVRGQIVTVIDLKIFFELPVQGLTDLNKVIIVHNEDTEFGILADLVVGVRSIARGTVQPALPTLTGVRAQYSQGVVVAHAGRSDAKIADQPLVVLDTAKILTDPRMLVNEEVA